MWRLIYFVPIWALFLIFRTLLILLGWILIPIAALAEAYDATPTSDGNGNPGFNYHFTWRFMWLWDNAEDGIANSTYWQAPNMFLQIMYWNAIRNPVNNLRFLKYASVKYDVLKLEWIGSYGSSAESAGFYDKPYPHWFLCWQGCRSNLYIQWEMFGQLWRFWIGDAKLYPDAIIKIPTYQIDGVGPVLQFKRVKRPS